MLKPKAEAVTLIQKMFEKFDTLTEEIDWLDYGTFLVECYHLGDKLPETEKVVEQVLNHARNQVLIAESSSLRDFSRRKIRQLKKAGKEISGDVQQAAATITTARQGLLPRTRKLFWKLINAWDLTLEQVTALIKKEIAPIDTPRDLAMKDYLYSLAKGTRNTMANSPRVARAKSSMESNRAVERVVAEFFKEMKELQKRKDREDKTK